MQLLSGGKAWTIDRQGRAISRGEDQLAPVDFAPAPSLGARLAANPMVHDASWMAQRAGPDGAGLLAFPRGRPLGDLNPFDRVLAGNENAALIHRRTANGVSSVEVVLPGDAPREVLTINANLADVTTARILRVVHKGSTGELLTSWLYLPGAKTLKGPRPPMVVMPYPSDIFPQPAISTLPGELRFPVHPQVLVGAGYAVLMPSLPFDRAASEPMTGIAAQILKVVDAAVATGEVDGERLALLGHSFGAYAAMASATQTNRFKAIIAIAGISDLVSYWGVMPVHYRVVPQDGLFFAAMAGLAERGHPHQEAPPWSNPGRYIRNSPLLAANRIQTPMMLVHGDQDEVGPNQSEEMFAALYRQGKDAKLVTYWGEGHAILSPANVRDLYARVFSFLGDHLKADTDELDDKATP
jgi:dipeptidyl aminopeptidase/acylaminoacyl peptidase